MTDEEIVDLYFGRSENALKETDQKYGAKCRAAACNILKDHGDSEECTNDTYMKMWNAIPPNRPPHLYAFIIRIVRNTAIDMIRRREAKRRSEGNYAAVYDEIKDCIPAADNVEKTVEAGELTELIERFLNGQNKDKKTMFMMRYFSFCSVAEIAAKLGVSESKVTVTLTRVRSKLREYLEKEGIDI
jgi:RNA polymerase sigma-70 factor (ECF subfamily)